MPDQYNRAFIGIPLNIVEGSGKQSGNDQAKFYAIVRESALECGVCLAGLVAMKLADTTETDSGKLLLKKIVAMNCGNELWQC